MKLKQTITAIALGMTAAVAYAETTIGVSWSKFQEER